MRQASSFSLSSSLPNRSLSLAMVAVLAVLAAGAVRTVQAQGPEPPVWEFESVAARHEVPGCVLGMTLAGFDHDALGRPVVGWREENNCGSTPRVFWTRKQNGAWATNEFLSERAYGGGAEGDFAHRLVLRPSDGNPFLIYRDVGDGNSLNTYRTDLGAYPNGGASDILEGLVGPQQCADLDYSLAFAPGEVFPDWATGLTLCNGTGPVKLNGAQVGSAYTPKVAITVTPDGTRHVLWNSADRVYYTHWAPGDPAATTNPTPLFTSVNSYGGEVALVADANGVIHAVVRGVEGQSTDGDKGAVAYFKSIDNGQTWTPFEYVDSRDAVPNSIGVNHDVSLAVDSNGVPVVTYWRGSDELWYARRDGINGAWTESRVTTNSGAAGPRSAQLDFDATGRPVIAFYDVDAAQVKLARLVAPEEPPTVLVPDDIVAEATGPAGAVVTFSASAVDENGGALTVTCTPAAGTAFPIATTMVSCSATSGGGLTSTQSFSIRVQDTTPPTLSLPGNITTTATIPAGAIVTFAATANDIVDGPVSVICSPSSGSTFPVGTTHVTCTASDAATNQSAGSFDVTVTGGNRPPIAVDDVLMTAEDERMGVVVVANDSDPDLDPIAIASVTPPQHGTFLIRSDRRAITYIPYQNFHGADQFTYTISDARGGTATARVAVTVRAVNDAPNAVDDNATTPQGSAVIVNVLRNDTDCDGDTLIVVAFSQARHGTVSLRSGNLEYVPAPGFYGTDLFSYTVSDGHGGTDVGYALVVVSRSVT